SAVSAADLEALRAELASMRRDLDDARARIAESETERETESETESESESESASQPSFSPFGSASARNPLGNPIGAGLYLSSYIQAQYTGHEDSRNELTSEGQPLNQDGFALRRARLKLVGEAE